MNFHLVFASAFGLTLVLGGCSEETREEIDATYDRLDERGIGSDNVVNENILADASGVWVKVKAEIGDNVFYVEIEDRDGEMSIVKIDDDLLAEPIDIIGDATDELERVHEASCS